MEWINKYRALDFEKKTMFNTKFSIIFNGIMAVSKAVLSIFLGFFFFIAGIVNFCTMFSKLECYRGVKYPEKRSFKYRTRLIAIFLMIAGGQYAFYMTRLVFFNVEVYNYDMILGIIIACISFVEVAFAVKGIFNAVGHGHYYRNIKIISLSSALTAIILTMIAILSFASESDNRILCGASGMAIGFVIILLGIYVLYAPKISIMDRKYNVYKKVEFSEEILTDDIKIRLTNHRFYADYYYEATKNKDMVSGEIIKGKNPFWKWNIYIKILVILLSEILIFPYAIGALVSHLKGIIIVKRLDSIMNKYGYVKVSEGEEIYD